MKYGKDEFSVKIEAQMFFNTFEHKAKILILMKALALEI